MSHLGFDRFSLAGHDRGAYTAFRCALDHPASVTRLAVLDVIPIIDTLERATAKFAMAWWHWFFYCTPDKPERAINADPLAWYGLSAERMGAENFADILAAIKNPAVIHSMIEDYRAGPVVDLQHDAADRSAGRRITCPTLALWAQDDDLEYLYGDVLAIWRDWANDLRGHSFPSGHHMSEERPDLLAKELAAFFSY